MEQLTIDWSQAEETSEEPAEDWAAIGEEQWALREEVKNTLGHVRLYRLHAKFWVAMKWLAYVIGRIARERGVSIEKVARELEALPAEGRVTRRKTDEWYAKYG